MFLPTLPTGSSYIPSAARSPHYLANASANLISNEPSESTGKYLLSGGNLKIVNIFIAFLVISGRGTPPIQHLAPSIRSPSDNTRPISATDAADVVKHWYKKKKARASPSPDGTESQKSGQVDTGGNTQGSESDLGEMYNIERAPETENRGLDISLSYKTIHEPKNETVSRGYYTVDGGKNMSVNNPDEQSKLSEKINLIREKEKKEQSDSRAAADEADQPSPKKIKKTESSKSGDQQ